MLRTLIAAALGALLVLPVSSVSAQSNIVPAPAMGRAFGAWDLPGARDAGHVRGVLVDALGRRFALEAKLLPSPVRATSGEQIGRMMGVLLPIDRAGDLGRPIADVVGEYKAGPDGLGRFAAAITALDPLAPRAGKMEGAFADPNVRGRDPVGRFSARWAIR